MGISTTHLAPQPSVLPGEEAENHLTIRNDGLVVDAFTFEPIGVPAPWITVEPAELALLPGEEGVVVMRFTPPRAADVAPGIHSWGLRVISREDPDSTSVEEGQVEVGAFTEVEAELLPRTSTARGRRSGTHEVAVDNRGNTTAVVALSLADPDEKVNGTIDPTFVEVAPGRSQVAKVKVSGRERHWRGANRTLPIQVLVTPPDADTTTLSGNLLQRPILPPWALKALLGLLVLAMLLGGLWVAVLRPTIESSAREAAVEEAEKVADEAAAAQEEAAAEQKAAMDELAGKVEAGGQPTPTPTPTPTEPATIDPLGDPVATRLAATKTNQKPSAVLDEEKVVSVTDLLLQNPAGDTGLVRVTRDGKTIYAARLENFRDLDLHLVAQLSFDPGMKLGLEVTCENAPELNRPCTPGITVSGFARTPAP